MGTQHQYVVVAQIGFDYGAVYWRGNSVADLADNEPLYTRKQAAEYLRRRGCSISYNTLTNMASNQNASGGPSFYKDGGRAVYAQVDLDQWRRQRLRRVE